MGSEYDEHEQMVKQAFDAALPMLIGRLVKALRPETVKELANYKGDLKPGEIAEWLLGPCADELDRAAASLKENPFWEVRCARCGGRGRFGIMRVSPIASVQWDRRPHECSDVGGCDWPNPESWAKPDV